MTSLCFTLQYIEQQMRQCEINIQEMQSHTHKGIQGILRAYKLYVIAIARMNIMKMHRSSLDYQLIG